MTDDPNTHFMSSVKRLNQTTKLNYHKVDPSYKIRIVLKKCYENYKRVPK